MHKAGQRIDRWLWHARVVKTRTLAASLSASGHVRINGKRVETAAQSVHENDVLTIALPARVRVLRVTGFTRRRSRSGAALALYEEIKRA